MCTSYHENILASKLYRPFPFTFMHFKTMALIIMFLTKRLLGRNFTLDPKLTMAPTNNKFFFKIISTWKNLNLCFISLVLNFAIMFPSPTTWWLFPFTIIIMFLWGDFLKETKRSLLLITCLIASKSKYEEEFVDNSTRHFSKPSKISNSFLEVNVFFISFSNG